MGCPMTWKRLVLRNHLSGSYPEYVAGHTDLSLVEQARASIAGDMRRIEQDQTDAVHLAAYAKVAGITELQAKIVLQAFFHGAVASVLSQEEWDGLHQGRAGQAG